MGFKASTTSKQSSAQTSLEYGTVRLFTKQNKGTLLLQKWKHHGTELKKLASILWVYSTSKLSRRHYISTRRCSSSLWFFCTALFRRKATKPLDIERRPDSLASTFARIDFVWPLLIDFLWKFGVPWAL